MNEPTTNHLLLSDGRTLSYSDTGTGENGTWIHCHGIPGSRYELLHLSDQLYAAGLRIIVADRPGYGDSTPCPDNGFAQHTSDICQLADQLGLERFSVSGFSGGGVFALATAHDIGDRAERLTIAATPAVPLMQSPFDQASELTANSWKAALENVKKLAVELEELTGPEDVLCEALMSAVGPDEEQYLSSEPVRQAFYRSIRTALQQGSTESARALARDTRLIVEQWPFSLAQLNLPTQVIHGECDQLVHQEHQTALIQHLPRAEQRFLSGKGHFSLLSSLYVDRTAAMPDPKTEGL